MTYYQQQLHLIRKQQFPKDYLCEQVLQAKLFIDQNFSEDINLNGVASEACFSKYHFLRLFKLMYGRTPYQYLTEVRIDKAKKLLRSGIRVSQVCFLVGLNSVSSFKELFKRCTGFTPFLYQQQLKLKRPIVMAPLRFQSVPSL